jgi:hypothetical protein
VAAAPARADVQAEHNHDRSREVADDKADEPPQAHDYCIGSNRNAHDPSSEFTRDTHERTASKLGATGATWVGSSSQERRRRPLFSTCWLSARIRAVSYGRQIRRARLDAKVAERFRADRLLRLHAAIGERSAAKPAVNAQTLGRRACRGSRKLRRGGLGREDGVTAPMWLRSWFRVPGKGLTPSIEAEHMTRVRAIKPNTSTSLSVRSGARSWPRKTWSS